MRRALLGTLLFVLATPALAQVACTLPQKPMLDIELMLGRGSASDVRWREFLAREVTPRFPDGLTVYEATGQWRDPQTGKIGRERSRVLRIIVTNDAAVTDKITAVTGAYKRQFRQKSIGIVSRDVCASF